MKSPDLIVRPGVDARLELELVDGFGKPQVRTGWTAELVVKARHGGPTVFAAALSHRPGSLVLEVPGDESATWTFGIGRYEIWMCKPGRLDVPHAGRVLVDRR